MTWLFAAGYTLGFLSALLIVWFLFRKWMR